MITWAGTGFGDLNGPFMSRIIITGLMLIAISLQTFAFLLGIVAIPIRAQVDKLHA